MVSVLQNLDLFNLDIKLLEFLVIDAALYFIVVATVAALVGQHVVRKMISLLKRASLIIFILAFIILVSAISLGKHEHLLFNVFTC